MMGRKKDQTKTSTTVEYVKWTTTKLRSVILERKTAVTIRPTTIASIDLMERVFIVENKVSRENVILWGTVGAVKNTKRWYCKHQWSLVLAVVEAVVDVAVVEDVDVVSSRVSIAGNRVIHRVTVLLRKRMNKDLPTDVIAITAGRMAIWNIPVG
jgi:hypothetical protein